MQTTIDARGQCVAVLRWEHEKSDAGVRFTGAAAALPVVV